MKRSNLDFRGIGRATVLSLAYGIILTGMIYATPFEWTSTLRDGIWNFFSAIVLPNLTQALSAPTWSPEAEIAASTVMVFIIFLFGYGQAQWKQWLTNLATLSVGLSVLSFTAWYFGFRLDAFSIICGPLIAAGVQSWLELLRVGRRRKNLQDLLTPLMSPGAVEAIMLSDGGVPLDGTTRRMTHMVGRIRNIFELQQLYRDHPDAMSGLLNQFHHCISQKVFKSGGALASFRDGSFTAFWNAPVELADHELRAADAAMAMVEDVDNLNEALEDTMRRQGLPFSPIVLSVGIATGHSHAGQIGSGNQARYSVIGEASLLADKLSRDADRYGPAILIGEHTHNAVRNNFALLELDMIESAPGKSVQRIYALIGNPLLKANPEFRTLQHAHQRLFAAYRNGQYGTARHELETCRTLSASHTKLHDLYEKRIEDLERRGEEETFDGIYRPSAA